MNSVRLFLKALVLNIIAWFVFLVFFLVVYFGALRDWQMNWGATSEDINRYMAGDELIEDPEFNATRAVLINAPPEEIWPWIIQIGYKKAGFYGFDNLDNGGMASVDRIIPEFQNLKVGDGIPGGEYKGKTYNLMEVVSMEPYHSMLWVFLKGTPWAGATWSWGFYEVGDKHTKLVSRLRQQYTFRSIQEIVSWSMIDAIEIVMMRTTLRGIKYRAEKESGKVLYNE